MDGPSIAAERVVESHPAALFAFLADLQRHWELLPDALDVVSVNGKGAVVRLRGPLGIRRTMRTRVTEVRAPVWLAGRATGPSATALVSWSLASRGDATLVRLAVEVERASLRDRLLLAVGGGAWLRRRLTAALARLDAAVAPAAALDAA